MTARSNNIPIENVKERFLAKARSFYGDKYSYDKVIYTDSQTKVCINCSIHGDFEQTPSQHLKSEFGCPKCAYEQRRMPSKIDEDRFLMMARQIHGDTYDYSLVKYLNGYDVVNIICRTHGPFEQRPRLHLRGNGCWQCHVKRSADSRRMGREDFEERSKKKHGDVYDYSLVDYSNNLTKVKIKCSRHGVFDMTPSSHLGGQGCPKCGREKSAEWRTYSTEEYIEKCLKTHGGVYDYSEVDYHSCERPITIICKRHGRFNQKPVAHLTGRGCSQCALERRHRFKKDRFIENSPESVRLYLIEAYNDTERFLKIGITRTSVKLRFAALPYHHKVIKSIVGDPSWIWDMEEKLHKECRAHRYEPKIFFKGHTECYDFVNKRLLMKKWREVTLMHKPTPKAEDPKKNDK